MPAARPYIIGLDLGRHTGFAAGVPNEKPRSLTVTLTRGRAAALSDLIEFLDREFRVRKPAIVLKEAPLSLQAFKQLNMGEAVVRMTYALHGVVEGICERWRVRCCEQADSTIRKHFIGKGRLGNREATKRAVISRCIQLGYLSRSSEEDDRADALAAWDYAGAHIARIAPAALHLFED